VGLLTVHKINFFCRITYFSRWRFEYSSFPIGGEFDFSKIQIPTTPPPLFGWAVVGG